MKAFEITVDDVLSVLSKNANRVKTGQKRDLIEIANTAFSELDMHKIERASLAHATDLDEQTEDAHVEIERQLVEAGVMSDGASDEVPVSVSLNVVYRADTGDAEHVRGVLNGSIASAVGAGLLDADGYMPVISWESRVDLLSAKGEELDEDDIAQWLERRVKDGELSVEDLVRLAARYALANRVQLLNELAERIGMQDEEDDEGSDEMVSARCWSDDRVVEVDFNAAPWLSTAGGEDILALAACGWRGDYAADKVAEWEAERNPDVSVMFEYVNARAQVPNSELGFECSVDEEQAKAWLQTHRRDVWVQVICQEADVTLVQAHDDEIAGRWDWIGQNGMASELSFETRTEAAMNAAQVLSL